jgi:hypothetical protein
MLGNTSATVLSNAEQNAYTGTMKYEHNTVMNLVLWLENSHNPKNSEDIHLRSSLVTEGTITTWRNQRLLNQNEKNKIDIMDQREVEDDCQTTYEEKALSIGEWTREPRLLDLLKYIFSCECPSTSSAIKSASSWCHCSITFSISTRPAPPNFINKLIIINWSIERLKQKLMIREYASYNVLTRQSAFASADPIRRQHPTIWHGTTWRQWRRSPQETTTAASTAGLVDRRWARW